MQNRHGLKGVLVPGPIASRQQHRGLQHRFSIGRQRSAGAQGQTHTGTYAIAPGSDRSSARRARYSPSKHMVHERCDLQTGALALSENN
jgi:hypothetical protein